MNNIFSKFLISLYTSASQKCLTNIQSVEYMSTNCILVGRVPCGFTFKVKLTMSVSENTLKKIGHHACIGDIMCQTYPIYACTGKNHSHYFIGPQYILLQLETNFKITWWKERFEQMEQLIEDLWENCKNLRDINSNYSLSCTFQGCSLHPWVTALCMLSALPFFPFKEVLISPI